MNRVCACMFILMASTACPSQQGTVQDANLFVAQSPNVLPAPVVAVPVVTPQPAAANPNQHNPNAQNPNQHNPTNAAHNPNVHSPSERPQPKRSP